MQRKLKSIILPLVISIFLTAVFIVAQSANQPVPGELKFTVLYSGSRNSELIPCGCKGRKALGGVDKEAHYFKTLEATQSGSFLRLDAGGWTDQFLSENERLKTKYLIMALGKMNMHAVNVGYPDLMLSINTLQEEARKNNLNLISANVVNKDTLTPIFTPYITKGVNAQGTTVTVGIIGVTCARETPQPPQFMQPAASPIPPTPQPSPTFNPPPQLTPSAIPRTQIGPEAEDRQYYFDFQYKGAHYFQQGPDAFKKIVQPTPTPVPPPPGFFAPHSPSLLRAETTYRTSTSLMPPAETQYLQLPPQPSPVNTGTPHSGLMELNIPEFDSAVIYPAKGDGSDSSIPAGGAVSKPTAGITCEGYLIIPAEQALEKYLPVVREKADVIILLAYMTLPDAEELAKKINPVDIIIAGKYTYPMQAEPKKIGKTFLVSCSINGDQLGRLDITLQQNKQIVNVAGTAVSLTVDDPKDPEMEKLIEEQKEEIAKLFRTLQQQSVVTTVSYAGANSCRVCHSRQYDQWEKTAHAKAMSTLINQKQQYNPDCLPCHTTGYKTDNGFVDLRSTPRFTNVQCESCHGKSYKHTLEARRWQLQKRSVAIMSGSDSATSETKVVSTPNLPDKPNVLPMRSVPASVCLGCHTDERDADFDYERDILIVKH